MPRKKTDSEAVSEHVREANEFRAYAKQVFLELRLKAGLTVEQAAEALSKGKNGYLFLETEKPDKMASFHQMARALRFYKANPLLVFPPAYLAHLGPEITEKVAQEREELRKSANFFGEKKQAIEDHLKEYTAKVMRGEIPLPKL